MIPIMYLKFLKWFGLQMNVIWKWIWIDVSKWYLVLYAIRYLTLVLWSSVGCPILIVWSEIECLILVVWFGIECLILAVWSRIGYLILAVWSGVRCLILASWFGIRSPLLCVWFDIGRRVMRNNKIDENLLYALRLFRIAATRQWECANT